MIGSEKGEMEGANRAWLVVNLNAFTCCMYIFRLMCMPVECFNRIGG